MLEEKIIKKSKSLYFFLIGHYFSPSERSSSEEYNFCGPMNIVQFFAPALNIPLQNNNVVVNDTPNLS